MPSVFLGVDLGTSGVRVLAIDAAGQLVAEQTASYPLLTPHPGWTEQDPLAWRTQSLAAIRALVDDLEGYRIEALGLSGQMHGMVPLDASGEVIRPALLWNDQRTGAEVEEIEAAVPRKTLIQRTGNRAATGFQLPKVLWLRKQEPGQYARLAKALLPKDYLGYILTGTFAAEPSDASGTGCFNLAAKSWDDAILNALSVPPSLFPSILPSDETVGTVTAEAARLTGLPQGLPVIAGAGDNAAAATGLGLSNQRPGVGSVSLGTSGVIFLPLSSPTPDPDGRVHLFCHADGGYHLLGVTLSAAGSLQWFHDTLAPDTPFSALVAEAEASPVGARGVTFRPYLAGERSPHMDPSLRASFTGLSLATRREDLVRAILEGVTFSLRDTLDVMLPLGQIDTLLATGGGARSPFWLQMVCDVLQTPLRQPALTQGAAYGAALLAFQGTNPGASLDPFFRVDGTAVLRPGPAVSYAEALSAYQTLP